MKHMIGTKTSALRRAVALCMVLICLCGCALPLLTSCEEISGKVTTLYVYNWGEYISDGSEDSLDSNAAFEEWYYEMTASSSISPAEWSGRKRRPTKRV